VLEERRVRRMVSSVLVYGAEHNRNIGRNRRIAHVRSNDKTIDAPAQNTHEFSSPDRELAFDGSVTADVVDSWRNRFDRMKLLQRTKTRTATACPIARKRRGHGGEADPPRRHAKVHEPLERAYFRS
jgi:hypothetical protein